MITWIASWFPRTANSLEELADMAEQSGASVIRVKPAIDLKAALDIEGMGYVGSRRFGAEYRAETRGRPIVLKEYYTTGDGASLGPASAYDLNIAALQGLLTMVDRGEILRRRFPNIRIDMGDFDTNQTKHKLYEDAALYKVAPIPYERHVTNT